MRIPAFVAFLALIASPAWSQDWTRFRGPNGTGISPEKGVPVTWTEKDFRWRVPIAGESHSQPVIWGDKLFLESANADGKERMLVCISKADGKELWVKKHPMATHAKHKLNSYASSTPTVDKDRVYASFADREKFLVKAWDHSGKELWSADLGPFISQHGLGASPIIYEEKLIVTNDQDGTSFIIALDLATGKQVWKCPRKGVEQNAAYGTPCIFERKGAPPQILTTSYAHGISGLDPKTGTMLWEAKVFDKRSVSSPVVAGDFVFGSCGSGAFKDNFVAAVKLGGRGDVTSSHLAYLVKDKESPYYVPTPIAVDGRLFMISDKGFATCIEASTGRVVWKENVNGSFCGSPVLVDGRLYCPSEKGEMVVLDASESFKVVARNPLGEGSRSTPCVEGGRFYVKTFTHLVCVGGK